MASPAVDVEDLRQRLRQREDLFATFQKKYGAMKEDYLYNLQVIAERDRELAVLTDRIKALQDALSVAEGKCQSQRVTLDEVGERVNAATAQHRDRIDALQAQLNVCSGDKLIAERKVQEATGEVVTLREEVQRLQSALIREVDSARKNAAAELEADSRERERLLRDREASARQEARALEARLLEHQSENARLREALRTSELKLDEAQKALGQKDNTVAMLQAQAAELKRSIQRQTAQNEVEAAAMSAAKEQLEKASGSHFMALEREIERRQHDIELLEQKLASANTTHEQELRRKHEEREDLLRQSEEKLRAAQTRATVAESRVHELTDALTRHQNTINQLRKTAASQEDEIAALKEDAEEQRRSASRKDVEVQKLNSDLSRCVRSNLDREREVELMRMEFERKEAQERAQHDMEVQTRVESFRRTAAAAASTFPASHIMASPIGPNRTALRSNWLESQQSLNLTSGGVAGATPAAVRPNDVPMAPPPSANRDLNSSTAEALNDIQKQLAAQQSEADLLLQSRREASQLRRELALVKEQHERTKDDMQSQLDEVKRQMNREKRRAELSLATMTNQHSAAADDSPVASPDKEQQRASLHKSSRSPPNTTQDAAPPQRLSESPRNTSPRAAVRASAIGHTAADIERLKEKLIAAGAPRK